MTKRKGFGDAITPEEDVLEWEAAMDLDVYDVTSLDMLRDALERELGYAVSDRQVEVIWRALETKYTELGEYGYTPYLRRTAYGTEIRYTIKGQRGLFGAEEILKRYRLLGGRNLGISKGKLISLAEPIPIFPPPSPFFRKAS